MPAVTYYDVTERTMFMREVKDKEIMRHLGDANNLGGSFFVREFRKTTGRFWRKKEIVYYCLYHALDDYEVQCVNFAKDDDFLNPLFGFNATRATVLNFLMGFIGGSERMRKVGSA